MIDFRRIKDRLVGGDSGRVFKGMTTLALGTGSARLIGLASIPLLARIYAPEDYGLLSVFTGLVAIVSPIVGWRYALAIPLPRQDRIAMNLMILSGTLSVATSVLIGAVLWAFGEPILRALSMEALFPWWWLISLCGLTTALYETLSMWATRHRSYSVIARTQVTQSLLGEATKLCLGLLSLKPVGLLFGQLVSQSAGVGTFLTRFGADFRSNWQHVRIRRMSFLARYYRSFPLYRLPSVVLLALSVQAPLLLTAALYGQHTTGQLGMALMALALPAGLLADNMGKAYFAEISRMGRRNPAAVRRLTHATIKRAFLISIVPATLLLIAGKHLFALGFGRRWEEAGAYASILSVYLLSQFMQRSTAAYLMSLYDGQKELLILNVQRLAMTAACFWGGWRLNFPFERTLLIYSILVSAHYIFSMVVAVRKIPKVCLSEH